MPEIILNSPSDSIVVYDAREELPQEPHRVEILHDELGAPVVYEESTVYQTLHLLGRLVSDDDAEKLLTWRYTSPLLSVTGRDGGTDGGGWTFKPDQIPRLRRKDGDSPDWEVEFTLWKIGGALP